MNINDINSIEYENMIHHYIDENNDILDTQIMEHSKYMSNTGYWHGNLHTIEDILIQTTGRFCEEFCSDLLIEFRHIQACLDTNDFDTRYFAFGIRQRGVDGIPFIAANIRQNDYKLSHGYYRKIYAIKATDEQLDEDDNATIKIQLKDISNLDEYDIKHMTIN